MQQADHASRPWPDPQVVFGHLPAPSLEQTRAAASGRAAVQIVERRVEVPTRLALTRRDWSPALQELARQLDGGRVYDRDLNGLSVALDAVLEAHNRRPSVRLPAADAYRATWGHRYTPR